MASDERQLGEDLELLLDVYGGKEICFKWIKPHVCWVEVGGQIVLWSLPTDDIAVKEMMPMNVRV